MWTLIKCLQARASKLELFEILRVIRAEAKFDELLIPK